MKRSLLISALLLVWLGVFSQTLPYTDDFESYPAGSFLAGQNATWWTTWSNLPGSGEDGVISTAFANTPTRSVKVETATDLILKLGNKTTGKYELKWKMYIETGYGGYYNIQHFQSPGIEYAFEVLFGAAGNAELYAGSTTPVTFVYPKNSWFEVKHEIDLDADIIKLLINGTLVHQWPFHYQSSSTTGTNQLGGVDFYAGAMTGETPRYYFDDITYQYLPTILYQNGFDTYTLNSYVAVNDPTWFTTWSNAPGTGEDALIKNDFSHSPSNSALVATATDLVMKLGNKTTGEYELTWWMYVPSSKGGYYNLQHFQSPGIEFACEVYFLAAGGGELYAGSATPVTFTHPKSTWFEVKHLIDLDDDLIKLYINGTLVHQWPFHYQASSTTGTKQLGGVDFYAGAVSGETPTYYFDDVYFALLGAASEPNIGVAPASITSNLGTNQSEVRQITVSNTGTAALTFSTNVILNSDALQGLPGNNLFVSAQKQSAVLGHCSADPNPQPATNSVQTDATAILHYDGDNASAIGWNSPPITVTVAARFPNALTLPHAGMYLESVDVYINDLNTTGSNVMTIKVYGQGNSYEPGTLLSSQTFTPAGSAWETIMLPVPVLVTGQDLWIGYTFTQTDALTYIPGCDAGPVDPNGDFLSTGVGWSHLSNNPSLPYNWNIRGNLNGTPFPQWLSVSPTSGSVAPAGNQILDVTINSTGLANGTYNGIVRILSNDPTEPQVDVPVTLVVAGPACPAPLGLAVSSITSSSAQVTWNSAPTVDIDYGPPGHTAGSGTIVSTIVNNPYSLLGLSSLTTYDIYIRQDCGSGSKSPWAGPVTFTTLDQYVTTVYPFNMTDGTGYVTNGNFLKKGPWMNTSNVANDTLGRGYVKFDLSGLPANAIISKATFGYYNFAKQGSTTAANYIFPLSGDPMTATGPALYSDCSDGNLLWTGSWTGTAPLWITSALNADGRTYIADQISSGWAGFGLVRGSGFWFRFSGYNDPVFRPYLYLEYHVPTAPILSITPETKDFEDVNLGIQSLPQTYLIKNMGTGNILVDAVSLGGADASHFLLTDGNSYPANLGPGGSITVTVAFKPTTVGVKNASLVVTENENDHLVNMTGNGYLNGPRNLTATPVIGPYVDLAWEAPLPLTEIRYDDNTAENYYYWGPSSTTNMYYYTKITIPVSGTLTNIGVLSLPVAMPIAWASISLCPDLGGVPNLAAPVQSFPNVPATTGDLEWLLQTLTPLAVTAGQNYYIVVQWPSSAAGGLAVATDAHNNHFRCGASSNGGVSWNISPYNYMMRAYMTVPGDNPGGEPIVLGSGHEMTGMDQLPLLVSGSEPKESDFSQTISCLAPAVIMKSGPTRSFTSYTVNRGTVAGTYTTTFTGVSGTTYQDITTAPTTTYYYMVSAVYSNGTANSNEASATTFEICPVPIDLGVSNTTTTSADLSWIGNGTVLWDLEWGLAGFTQGTGTTVTGITSTPYNLGGLSQGTSYSFYVRSDCGGGIYSSWAGPFTFTTLCAMVPAPILEDFELLVFPPACWSKSSGTPTWDRSALASGYGVGTGSARANFYSISAITPFHLMTLSFDASSLYLPVLKFDYAYATYIDEIDSLKIYYSTDEGVTYSLLLNMPGGLTGVLNTGGALSTSFVPTASQWATQSIVLPTGTNKVRFTAISAYGNNLYVDNVKVEGTPCPAPSGLSANNITATSADLDWTENGTATLWDLEYGNAGFPPGSGSTIYGITSKPYTLSGLTPLTSYEYRVRANCGGVYNGAWSTLFPFTTAAAIPEFLTLEGVTVANGQTECYNALNTIYVAGNNTTFVVENGGSATFIAGMMISYLPGFSVQLGGYMHGYISTGTYCGGMTPPIVAAGAAGVGTVPSISAGDFVLFPNPASASVTIRLKDKNLSVPLKAEIVSMTGEKVFGGALPALPEHNLDVSDLAPGLYFVRLTHGDQVVTLKLVKM